MKTAALPANEKERLEFLRALNVLDTPLEERFERITRMLCRAMNVPIAAISLVDEERQWFKSIQGIEARETSRCVAFCAHTILDDNFFVVEDATKDERFAENPLVTDYPHIRFYAGYPLFFNKTIKIGTLCAIDRKAHHPTPDQLETLRDLAKMVETEFSLNVLSEASQKLIEEAGQAERAALIDTSTQVWNRKAADTLLKKEWEIASWKGASLAIVMIRVQPMEASQQEETMRHATCFVLSSLRAYDSLARWDNNTLIVLCPQCLAGDLSAITLLLHHSLLSNISEIGADINLGAAYLEPNQKNELSRLLEKATEALNDSITKKVGSFEIAV